MGAEANPTVRVSPICATCWDGSEFSYVETFDIDGLAALKRTAESQSTVWIEASLQGLSTDKKGREWFEGSFGVWDSMANPIVDWGDLEQVLRSVDLPTPAPRRTSGEDDIARLIRAIPYVYTRGTFGTIRDALLDERIGEKLAGEAQGETLTAFPIVGFHPLTNRFTEGEIVGYTAIRAMAAVARNVVLTLRLPNMLYRAGTSGDPVSSDASVSLDVPKRFFPLRRMPAAREVAEAIGIHQATTSRAIAARIRRRLKVGERAARQLTPSGEKDQRPSTSDRLNQRKLRAFVTDAQETTNEMAELAHEIDRQISQILRRFGDSYEGQPEPAKELVPHEVRRRYTFALDDIRQLHADRQLASRSMTDALAAFDHEQREQLQFVAALGASVVLIPTLIASVFGVNLGVPGEGSFIGFLAFVAAIVGLGAIGYSALRTAVKYHWSPPRHELRIQAAGVVAILVFLVGVLAVVS